MASKIEWTGETLEVTGGCSECSLGCRECFARGLIWRFAHKKGKQYDKYRGLVKKVGDKLRWTGKIVLFPEHLESVLKRRKPTTCFVDSRSDLFHPKVPFEFIDETWWTMSVSRQHLFQILTKRPERYLEYWQHRLSKGFTDGTRENIWAGVTVCTPDEKHKIDTLRQIPAAVRYLSIEPCLADMGELNLEGIDWVIVGGESGPGARPMHPDWVRGIRDQVLACGENRPSFFFKQWGNWAPWDFDNWDPNKYFKYRYLFEPNNCEDLKAVYPVGKKKAGRLLDGKEWAEYPKGGE